MITKNIKEALSLKKKDNGYIVINDGKEAVALLNNVLQPGESFGVTETGAEAIMKSGGLPYRMKNAMMVMAGNYSVAVNKRFELPKEKLVIQIF